MKFHLFIIVAIVSAFSTFMIGYSIPPFIEVGFGGGENAAVGTGSDDQAELMKQFEDLYKEVEE